MSQAITLRTTAERYTACKKNYLRGMDGLTGVEVENDFHGCLRGHDDLHLQLPPWVVLRPFLERKHRAYSTQSIVHIKIVVHFLQSNI